MTRLSPTYPGGRILRSMTQAQTRAKGVATPSLPQLWLGAMLRVLVELVLCAARCLRMRPSRLSGECHTDVTPAPLPAEHDGILMKADKAASHGHDDDRPPSCSHARKLAQRVDSNSLDWSSICNPHPVSNSSFDLISRAS